MFDLNAKARRMKWMRSPMNGTPLAVDGRTLAVRLRSVGVKWTADVPGIFDNYLIARMFWNLHQFLACGWTHHAHDMILPPLLKFRSSDQHSRNFLWCCNLIFTSVTNGDSPWMTVHCHVDMKHLLSGQKSTFILFLIYLVFRFRFVLVTTCNPELLRYHRR